MQHHRLYRRMIDRHRPAIGLFEKRWSAVRAFATIMAVIFAAEVMVMYLLPILLPPHAGVWLENCADGTLLTCISAPILWRLLIRPLRTSAANEQLRADTLFESETRFHALVANSSDVVAIVGSCGPGLTLRYLSPAVQRIWGHNPVSLIGTDLLDLIRPDDRARAFSLLEQCRQHPREDVAGELSFKLASGIWCVSEVVLVDLSAEPGIEGIVLTCRDITERKAFEAQLTHQAFHDALTGLPNRLLFLERTGSALGRAQRHQALIGVLFLDLDNFKVINDSLGHEAGDTLLVAVSERLQACVRPGDTVARLGGDEFTLLMEELTDETQAIGVAERITETLRMPFALGGHEVYATASLGIALSLGCRQTPDEIIRDADTAMYEAKTSGKAHSVVFHESMNTRAVERMEMEADLRRALPNGELRVFYQPILFLDSGQISEVEALVRWEHPTRGLVGPTAFIPLAEETGLIVPLGRWVLREACRQVAEWQALQPLAGALTVSVNLSAREMQQPDLIEWVSRALAETGLAAEHLKLEITESVMMENAEATIPKLHLLRALGIRLAVDDFGTGYSSMSYLSSLPIDTLKIDRSFVSKMVSHSDDAAIVRAIVTLAKTLGLQITSEGIETVEQLDQLHALGCDRGQGYYFARPLPAADMEEHFASSCLSGLERQRAA